MPANTHLLRTFAIAAARQAFALRQSLALLVASLLLVSACEGTEPAAAVRAAAPAQAGNTIAFVDVTVIPMDRERTLPGHTVLVSDGRISAVGPADEVDVPPQ